MKELYCLLLLSWLLKAGGVLHTVRISNEGFSPLSLSVSVYDSVMWTNADYKKECHSVHFKNGKWKSPDLYLGENWNFTFKYNGTFEYFDWCQKHLTGTVTVTEPPSSTTSRPVFISTAHSSDSTNSINIVTSTSETNTENTNSMDNTTGNIEDALPAQSLNLYDPFTDSIMVYKIIGVIVGLVVLLTGGVAVGVYFAVKRANARLEQELLLKPEKLGGHKFYYGAY